MRYLTFFLVAICAALSIGHSSATLSAQAPAAAVAQAPTGATYVSPTGARLRMLLGSDTFGGTEMEIGELTFPPNSDSGDHLHGAVESFYVLEGELEHVVDGKSQKLGPGMVGTVRPPARVRHKTGPAGARALVIWNPAGEAARVGSRWKREK
jgi:quercetin dioxygenase-like cupin family protein